jgi:hypothetical protein
MTVGVRAAEANSILDTLLGATPAFTIHVGDPGAAGTSNPSGADATKITGAMSSASAGSKALSANVGPWTNGTTAAVSETLSHVAAWITTVFKISAALTSSQAWVSTNTFTLTTFTVSVTPIAA